VDLTAPFGIAWPVLAGFAATSVIIELTPGPNMVYLAVVAATKGRRSGYAAVAGVALGLLIVGFAAALGLAAIINASPILYQALRWGGVAYLFWLAYDGWRDAEGAATPAPPGSRVTQYFRRGLITNLLNPKAAVFFVAVLPGFIAPAEAVVPQTLALSVIFVAVATAIHAAIVTAAAPAQKLLEDDRRSRAIRKALALALAVIAVWFAIKTRS
jgi:threonine/homoserine/homoserine lactone efflux protein